MRCGPGSRGRLFGSQGREFAANVCPGALLPSGVAELGAVDPRTSEEGPKNLGTADAPLFLVEPRVLPANVGHGFAVSLWCGAQNGQIGVAEDLTRRVARAGIVFDGHQDETFDLVDQLRGAAQSCKPSAAEFCRTFLVLHRNAVVDHVVEPSGQPLGPTAAESVECVEAFVQVSQVVIATVWLRPLLQQPGKQILGVVRFVAPPSNETGADPAALGRAQNSPISQPASPATPQANSTLTRVPMMKRSAAPVLGAFNSG